jgi:hypothetical protein
MAGSGVAACAVRSKLMTDHQSSQYLIIFNENPLAHYAILLSQPA